MEDKRLTTNCGKLPEEFNFSKIRNVMLSLNRDLLCRYEKDGKICKKCEKSMIYNINKLRELIKIKD